MSNNRNDHDHNSSEAHAPHPGVQEDIAVSERAKRALAIQALLIEKGVIGKDDVQSRVDAMGARSPADGAKVVARAWVDPQFKERLLSDAKAGVAELGYTLQHEAQLAVMENTKEVHHLIVCTLCSCYPGSLLGPPPDWYKSLAYRSRAVVDPRAVMREFGLELDESIEVRVVDSTADMRYMVLPQRPAGTDNMSEEELGKLVTRDSMIGVSNARLPESVSAP